MKLRRVAVLGNLLIAAVLMLAVWVLVVYVASRPALRTLIDLTPQSVNTVDPATEELLRELRDQKVEIEFHLFFPLIRGQGRNPAEQQYLAIRRRLQDLTLVLVRRYQWLGGESIKIFQHDFTRDIAVTREAASSFDYKPPFDEVVVTVRQPGQERRFRKLSLENDLATIQQPGMQNPGPSGKLNVPVLKQFLGEVQLSSAIKSLLVQGTPVVYFLEGFQKGSFDLENTAIAAAYGNFTMALKALGFETRRFNMARQRVVPRDASLVIVLEPHREFSDGEAQALFEYVRGGGRVFLNYAWAPLDSWNPTGGKLGELLGYEVGKPPVFHMIPDPQGRTGGRGLDGDPAVGKLQLAPNVEHPVTRRLANEGRPLEVANARELRLLASPPAGVTIEPLLRTGSNAWLARPSEDGTPNYNAPQVRLRSFVVGAGIEVAPDAETPDPAHGNGQVVIVSGLFCNNVGLELFGDLAFNICNWLTERRVLLNIQSSRYQPRKMDVEPPQTARVRMLLFQIVPAGLLIAGLLVFFVRRRL